ncbi:MAG: (2Fe-2S)-binding protein [Oceanospirillaceae bacterium]
MFRSLRNTDCEQVAVNINGNLFQVPAGSSVWAALALAKDTITRMAPVSEQPRSAYCAMGVCFECLVEIDGQPNRQACLTQVSAGMHIVKQNIVQSSQAEVAMYQPLCEGNSKGKTHD